MLQLILSMIHNAAEQHMGHLKLKVTNVKISEQEGEDVDKVVSLLSACYKTFESASTQGFSRIPVEWEKRLLGIFQTTSVEEFNKTFFIQLFSKE